MTAAFILFIIFSSASGPQVHTARFATDAACEQAASDVQRVLPYEGTTSLWVVCEPAE